MIIESVTIGRLPPPYMVIAVPGALLYTCDAKVQTYNVVHAAKCVY